MAVVTKSRGYSIGAMSNETGVHIETVRYYERIALMPKPDRTGGGHRQYNHEQLKRLFFIKRGREIGFSIEELKTLLTMVDRDDISCADVHEITVDHLDQVRAKIRSLIKLESVLSDMAAECSSGDVPECPIVEALFESPGSDLVAQ